MRNSIAKIVQMFSAIALAMILFQLPNSNGQMQVGTNLDRVADWGSTQFVDVLKHQRAWMTRAADGTGDWDTDFGSLVPKNRHGWPNELPFDPGNGEPLQIVHSVFPVRGPGNYRLIVVGKGKIDFVASDGLLDPSNSNNNRITVELTGGRKALNLRIHDSPFGNGVGSVYVEYHESNPADPIRSMRLISPGHARTHWKNPFLPSYTDKLAMFSNLRFMDWGSTNDSPLTSWDERTLRGSTTQAGAGGVAIEHMIQLANQQRQDLWLCIPAEADDKFVRNTAYFVRRQLRKDLKVFVEYSNETWNSIFSQTNYVQDQGELLQLSDDRWEAGQMFVAKRSAEVWSIFESQLETTSASRLVKVMASHSENSSLSRSRLDYLKDPLLNPTGIRADAISIAPYFGNSVPVDLVSEGVVGSVTPGEIVARSMEDMRNSATEAVELHRQIAEEYDMWLVLYEGGQHLVGSFEDFDNQTLTDKLVAANRHPAMYDVYYEYLNMLNDSDVVLFSNFSYVTKPSQYGSWGLLEDQDQPISEAPKYEAITDWIAANPPSNVAPIARPGKDRSTIDEDGDGLETITLDGSESRDFDGRITSYVWTANGETILEAATGEVELSEGRYDVTLTVTDNEGQASSRSVQLTIAPTSAIEVLVQSNFIGSSPSENTPWTTTSQLDENTTFSGWKLGNGFYAAGRNNVFAFAGDFDAEPRSLAAAVANNEYISFDVRPASGYELDLRGAEFNFTVERNSYHSPRRFVVMSNVDGFAVGQEVFFSDHIDLEGAPVELNFSIPFAGYRTGSKVEFRIYAIDGKWSGHEVSLNDFQVNGAAIEGGSMVRRLLETIPSMLIPMDKFGK